MCIQVVQGSALPGRSPREGILSEPHTFLSACLRTVAASIARSAQRRALRELAEDGRLLGDIGLTREQALDEAAKPFWRR
jgi:uncharacterized protein YjiS (DUF1127 family)